MWQTVIRSQRYAPTAVWHLLNRRTGLSRSERNPIRIPHTHVKRLKEEKSKLVRVSAACERLQELRSHWREMRLCTPRRERAESAVLSLSIPEIVLIV